MTLRAEIGHLTKPYPPAQWDTQQRLTMHGHATSPARAHQVQPSNAPTACSKQGLSATWGHALGSQESTPYEVSFK